jgi:hypothetical protein
MKTPSHINAKKDKQPDCGQRGDCHTKRSKTKSQNDIRKLQKTLGNQNVQKIVNTNPIQYKLKINQTDDRYEQEADRVADHVVRMEGKSVNSHIPVNVQRFESSAAGSIAAPPIVHEALQSSGKPLDPQIRGYMEERFGYDFEKVRVHSDLKDSISANVLNADAYTVGKDIVFNTDRNKAPMLDKKLLAHELTHVIQQSSVRRNNSVPSSKLNMEESADIVTSKLPTKSDSIKIHGVGSIGVAMQESKTERATALEIQRFTENRVFYLISIGTLKKIGSMPAGWPYKKDLTELWEQTLPFWFDINRKNVKSPDNPNGAAISARPFMEKVAEYQAHYNVKITGREPKGVLGINTAKALLSESREAQKTAKPEISKPYASASTEQVVTPSTGEREYSTTQSELGYSGAGEKKAGNKLENVDIIIGSGGKLQIENNGIELIIFTPRERSLIVIFNNKKVGKDASTIFSGVGIIGDLLKIIEEIRITLKDYANQQIVINKLNLLRNSLNGKKVPEDILLYISNDGGFEPRLAKMLEDQNIRFVDQSAQQLVASTGRGIRQVAKARTEKMEGETPEQLSRELEAYEESRREMEKQARIGYFQPGRNVYGFTIPGGGAALQPEVARQSALLLIHFAGSVGGFFTGFVKGLKDQSLTPEELQALNEKLVGTAEMAPILISCLVGGTIVGIPTDAWKSLEGLYDLAENWEEIQAQLEMLIKIVFSPEGATVAQVLGEEMAKQDVEKVKQHLVNDSTYVLSYELGKLAGPTIVYTVLSIVTGGAALTTVAARYVSIGLIKVLNKIPIIRAILREMKGIVINAKKIVSKVKVAVKREKEIAGAILRGEGELGPQLVYQSAYGQGGRPSSRTLEEFAGVNVEESRRAPKSLSPRQKKKKQKTQAKTEAGNKVHKYLELLLKRWLNIRVKPKPGEFEQLLGLFPNREDKKILKSLFDNPMISSEHSPPFAINSKGYKMDVIDWSENSRIIYDIKSKEGAVTEKTIKQMKVYEDVMNRNYPGKKPWTTKILVYDMKKALKIYGRLVT